MRLAATPVCFRAGTLLLPPSKPCPNQAHAVTARRLTRGVLRACNAVNWLCQVREVSSPPLLARYPHLGYGCTLVPPPGGRRMHAQNTPSDEWMPNFRCNAPVLNTPEPEPL